jgi:Flp pilus assembly protein TadG
MSTAIAHRRANRRLLRRLHRDRSGSAAVEFALVAPLFFGLLFAILEVGMVFLAGQSLETAAGDAARLVMTGQAQTQKMTAAKFKDAVCGNIAALIDCGGITVDVRSSDLTPTIPAPIVGGTFNPNVTFQPGTAGQIVVVRVFYQWPLFVTGLGFNISNISGNKRLLMATAAFRNEPF